MAPLLESDLIFPSASHSLSNILTQLKRSNLSITNRLHSIASDAQFVLRVADAYDLPIIANERCGSWYVPPERKAGSAYFKSTDGHSGQWSCSLRRLNVQVLDVVGREGGCLIVDSTRRGKSMPDALSKTVPIWATVMNRLLFPDRSDWHALETPDDVVSESEHAQIEARLEDFVREVRELYLDLDQLREKLCQRPLKVTLQRPGDALPDVPHQSNCENLIVLCTASNQTSNETSATSNYVQGAADDSESWARGLDATLFWKHSEWFLNETEDELPELIRSLVAARPANSLPRNPTVIAPGDSIWISNNASVETAHSNFDHVVFCNTSHNETIRSERQQSYSYLQCSTGKNGSRQLRTELPKIDNLSCIAAAGSRMLITCPTGRDIAVGVALAVLCMFCDEDGRLDCETSPAERGINKRLIKQRLSWIMVSIPDAAPSGATLQSVNAYLMG